MTNPQKEFYTHVVGGNNTSSLLYNSKWVNFNSSLMWSDHNEKDRLKEWDNTSSWPSSYGSYDNDEEKETKKSNRNNDYINKDVENGPTRNRKGGDDHQEAIAEGRRDSGQSRRGCFLPSSAPTISSFSYSTSSPASHSLLVTMEDLERWRRKTEALTRLPPSGKPDKETKHNIEAAGKKQNCNNTSFCGTKHFLPDTAATGAASCFNRVEERMETVLTSSQRLSLLQLELARIGGGRGKGNGCTSSTSSRRRTRAAKGA
uniref:Uncharacterized protein n=1 Tax=Pseudictyota dubia TaxID=2749911 RepID=A0A7R9W803_9STRA|mmetsp:Transcript_36383/g.67234  ORF Transcript_36383/g.67234 Transcript_36383/m.67234 type:complete len:260 (+) Transcript_36383:405-1184(+)